MPHLTDPTSTAANPAPWNDEMPREKQNQNCDNFPGVTPIDPFLARWLNAIANDGSLPLDALDVANSMARTVGVGRVASIDWQRINVALGRNRRDTAVFETMSELALEGYIDRNLDMTFGLNYGWLLLIPETAEQ